MRQLSELGDILVHRYRPLFQILKLLLPLDNSLGNMMFTKNSFEFWPVHALRLLMGFNVSIPPVSCGTRELVTSSQHLLMVICHTPVLGN
jgi:hypothetical protein